VTVLAIRGRPPTVETDRAVGDRLLERAADGRRVVRVWRPHRQVAFGRRETRLEGYERAREIARQRGFPPVERDVGGRAVAYAGSTVAFVRAEPAPGRPGESNVPRTGIDERYERASADLQRALSSLGVDVRRGEPGDSFCPGAHSLRARGKIVGIAQRVRTDAAITGGIVLVRDHAAVAAVLEPVYDALGTALDPTTVGSIARAGGDADPDRVVRAVESGLAGDADVRAVDVETVAGAPSGAG